MFLGLLLSSFQQGWWGGWPELVAVHRGCSPGSVLRGSLWCSKPGLWHAEHVLLALWAVSPALGINFVLISVQRRRTLKGEDLSVVFVYRRKCFVNCKTDSKYFTLKLRLFSCQLAYHSTISSTMLAITIKLKTRNKKSGQNVSYVTEWHVHKDKTLGAPQYRTMG